MLAIARVEHLAIAMSLALAAPAKAEGEQVSSPTEEMGPDLDDEADLSGLSQPGLTDSPDSETVFRADASRSSFPLRLVYGKRIDDAWIQLHTAAESPKGLKRRYSANKCEFTLTAEKFGVRVLKKTEDGFAIEKDVLPPQHILDASQTEPLHLSLVSDLSITIGEGSEAHCRKLFAGKKLRFATVKLEGTVYAESRAGARMTAAAATEPEAVEFFMTWDERNKVLRVVDQMGLSVALETPVMALPAGRDRIYYLSYEPAWRVERTSKAVAKK